MGLVLISHSGTLVDGLREMVAQVAGDDVAVGIAGGTEDGRLGTSAPRIAAALRSTLDAGAGRRRSSCSTWAVPRSASSLRSRSSTRSSGPASG